MYASAVTLLGQPGPQRGPLPHLQLGPLPGSLREPHPAPQPGRSGVVEENINASAQQRI